MKKNITIAGTVHVIATALELEAFTNKELLTAYNEIAKEPVKRFANKTDAINALFPILPKATNGHKPANTDKPKPADDGGMKAREKVRQFLKKGKVFTISDIAQLIHTDTKNANTTIQLLKSRPDKHHKPLILEKGKKKSEWKVVQPPTYIS